MGLADNIFKPHSVILCSGNTVAEAVFPKAHWAAAGNAPTAEEGTVVGRCRERSGVEWGHKKARQRWSMCGGGGRISVRTTRLSSGSAIYFRLKGEQGAPWPVVRVMAWILCQVNDSSRVRVLGQLCLDYSLILQRSEKWLVHGWVKFVPAFAYLFCLTLPGSCLTRFTNLFHISVQLSWTCQSLNA